MKVAVGVPCPELARYSMFYDSLLNVEGVSSKSLIQVRSANIAQNRNIIAEQAIAKGCDAVWYVDDDHIFAPQTLKQLVARDKDIVSGLYLGRDIPFIPNMYDREREDGGCYPKLLTPFSKGMVKVKAVGAGCLLVKTSVFEKMEKPWWRLGEIDKVSWGDDLGFCKRAREAGAEVWCDIDCPVGHMMNLVIWPTYQDGNWTTFGLQGNQVIAQWPAAMGDDSWSNE